MNKNSKIYIAGHGGLVGSSILKELKTRGYDNILTRTHKDVDLTDQNAVKTLFKEEKPKYVFMAAAKVGGIQANDSYPADFIRNNILIQTNVIDQAFQNGVQKLLFLGSSCIYPKMAPQPIKEEYLMSGELEATNQWYAVAKIAGIKMCQAYCRQYGFNAISCMPTNLYGPNDNFDLKTSHVLPALIRKFHEAKILDKDHVEIWGSGSPMREFLHVDDLANACVFLMETYHSDEIINVGTGKDISICNLAELIADIIGYHGKIVYDSTKPDGTPKKQLDTSKINTLGWYPSITLSEGIAETYKWYKKVYDVK
ncbi:MAG: GDP-L-fucose synthase [Desulfobacteraceae bacterium]